MGHDMNPETLRQIAGNVVFSPPEGTCVVLVGPTVNDNIRACADAWEADRKRLEAAEKLYNAIGSCSAPAILALGHGVIEAWQDMRAALAGEEKP